MALISLLLPTRGRPGRARLFLESVYRRAGRPENVEVILYLDDDDPGSHDIAHEGLTIKRIIGPRRSMGRVLSECRGRASGEILFLVNDDSIVRTPYWDMDLIRLHQAFDDRIYLGHVNDLYHGRRMCVFPVLSQEVCEILGNPFPEQYQGDLIDIHLMDIFKRLKAAGLDRIVYLEKVVVEHCHFAYGKSNIDATYEDRLIVGPNQAFAALGGARQQGAGLLARRISGSVPRRLQAPVTRFNGSQGMVRGILQYLKFFLRDPSTPLDWQLYLIRIFLPSFLSRRLLKGKDQAFRLKLQKHILGKLRRLRRPRF